MFELKPIGNPRGWHPACPACERPSFYHRELDRYFHVDGTTNRQCWCAISRGETVSRVVEHQAPAKPEWAA
jgi:hypothetical protein